MQTDSQNPRGQRESFVEIPASSTATHHGENLEEVRNFDHVCAQQRQTNTYRKFKAACQRKGQSVSDFILYYKHLEKDLDPFHEEARIYFLLHGLAPEVAMYVQLRGVPKTFTGLCESAREIDWVLKRRNRLDKKKRRTTPSQ